MVNDMDFNLNDLVNICFLILLMWKKLKILFVFRVYILIMWYELL